MLMGSGLGSGLGGLESSRECSLVGRGGSLLLLKGSKVALSGAEGSRLAVLEHLLRS
jgi:hypothetical protein